jgi:hypothetical protein
MDAMDITFGEPYIIHNVLITFKRGKIKEGLRTSPFLGARRRLQKVVGRGTTVPPGLGRRTKKLFVLCVRVSPALYGTNERPNEAIVLRTYGDKGRRKPQ